MAVTTTTFPGRDVLLTWGSPVPLDFQGDRDVQSSVPRPETGRLPTHRHLPLIGRLWGRAKDRSCAEGSVRGNRPVLRATYSHPVGSTCLLFYCFGLTVACFVLPARGANTATAETFLEKSRLSTVYRNRLRTYLQAFVLGCETQRLSATGWQTHAAVPDVYLVMFGRHCYDSQVPNWSQNRGARST